MWQLDHRELTLDIFRALFFSRQSVQHCHSSLLNRSLDSSKFKDTFVEVSVFWTACDHSDHVNLYREVKFTIECNLASPFTILDMNLCIYRNISPNSCCTQTPKCQTCGVGTEKVSIWKPWMFLCIFCQSVRCFDISLLKWSWQKSSGFILGALWISMLKFMAIPGMAFGKKKIFYGNKMFDSEWRQMKRRRITKCGWNHRESSRQDLKMLMFRLIRGTEDTTFWRFTRKLKTFLEGFIS